MRSATISAFVYLIALSSARAGLLPPSSPYVESGGLVQGEAENYHAKANSAVSPGTDAWVEVPTNAVAGATFENASGGLFFQTQPDDGTANATFNDATAGASVDYKITISTPGTYQLFLRWDGWDGASDSIYAGILEIADGIGGTNVDWYEDGLHTTSDFAQQNWDGLGQAEANVFNPAQNAMTFTLAAGTYTLRVVAREDGVALDAWRLQLASLPDPNPVATSSSSVIIGQDEFAYADGAIAGKNGGTNWDFDNTTNNDAFIGFTRQTASTWDAVFGAPVIGAGKLTTLDSGAKREYGSPSEGNGAVNDVFSSANRQVYYRVQMTRAAGATWTGISSYDFATERIFFGVPFNPNPSSGVREFGVEENGVTYSGVPVVDGVPYTLVAKIDFVNDVIALYVNPDFSKPESQNTPVASRPYLFGNWSTAVRLGSGGTSGNGAVTWDNLIVGSSWSAVQRAYPTNVPASGANEIVGMETFDYPGGNIVNRDGGTAWDFDNNNSGGGFVGHTQIQSNWDNVQGFPYVDGGRTSLATWESSVKREYAAPTEADGTFNNTATSQYKQLYYRFEMLRSGTGVTWSGVSAYDGTNERILFGVPFATNPSSGARELAIHNLGTNTHTFTGIAPINGARYNLVAKIDFVAGTVSLLVNPNFAAGEPAPTATMAWTGGQTTAIRFGSGGSMPTYWDDVAVTTSWAAMQNLFPTATAATGADLVIGAESFTYADGGIGGKSGGAHWDFENQDFGDGTATYTQQPSNWDVSFGSPSITSGALSTLEAGVLRQYNGVEADGAINKELGTVQRQVYYRFEMTRGAGATWSGASFFDFGTERFLVGVPFATNPSSGNREFAIHDLASGHTFTGIQPVAGQLYTIVAKMDYNAGLVSLWVNPNLALPEASNMPSATRPFSGIDWNTAIRLGSGGSAGTTWDNVAVGTSWRTIQAALGPPLTVADSVTMRHLSKVLIDVKRNDAGAGTVEIVTPPSFGTAVLDADGRIRYQHTTGTPASDSMTYRLAGISGQNSTPATVTFNFSNAMRLPNTTSNVPLVPPSTGLAVVDALPTVSFTAPTCMTPVPGSTTKLIVGERGGKLWLVPDVTSASATKQLFLDVAAVVNPRALEDFEDDGNELGLKGVAFHPNFASNGQFFVTYCLKSNTGQRYVRVARFTTVSGNPNLGDAASEQPFITQSSNSAIHNIDMCTFGPDGYLYWTAGDAGGLDDGAANSQRIDKDFWSSVFRIDVDRLPGNLEPNAHSAIALNAADSNRAFYKVPADNPFIGATTLNGDPLPGPGPVRTEIYALGFRNPWQVSFDSQAPHEMWAGEVGLDSWEEVNVITAGGNYGWSYKEGNAAGPKTNPPPGFAPIAPLWTYFHGGGILEGRSVTGGLVYRGTKYPTLNGKYVFGDFVSGHIWTLVRNGANPPTVERIGGEAGIVAFNLDPSNGDILMLDYGDGKVRRLTTQTIDNSFPAKLSDTGLFADLSDLTPNPGIEPYAINLPFWSDYARKSRYFTIPDPSPTFGFVQEGDWSIPTGAMWIKHFDFDQTRGNPATGKRLETRLLVKNSTGAYGVSYRWNDAGTEAYLVDDNGVDFDMNITVSGSPYTQHWRIPSRAECLNCHTPQGGHALSWETRQLNRQGTLGGVSGNFLSLLASAGYLSSPPSAATVANLPFFSTPTDTTQTVESRARSWLAVNCSYCHQAGGTGVAYFDLRPELSLTQTNMIDGALFNPHSASHKAIVRGSPNDSVILSRMAASNGYTRMPPLGTAELDLNGIQVVTDWINQSVTRSTYNDWRIANFGNGTSADGAQNFDADADGQSNFLEWLAGTSPLSGNAFFHPGVSAGGGNVSITFPNLQGRLIQVHTSTDLINWSLWNAPNNNGLPSPTGATRTLVAPIDLPQRFFRLDIREQ